MGLLPAQFLKLTTVTVGRKVSILPFNLIIFSLDLFYVKYWESFPEVCNILII